MIPEPPKAGNTASLPAGWNLPKPEKLAEPSWSPSALAFGITLLVWGLVISPMVLVSGLLVIIFAVGRWIGEICHERKPS